MEVVIETVREVKARHLVYDTSVIVKPHHTCGYALGLIPKRTEGEAAFERARRRGYPVGLRLP
ncbi:hypothetical protein [Actinomyces trachealis]|uniref:hypothetical protein n=1 Tax=Actinomyces trachealis TaxID=2763540 RepID=UPI001F18C725|nr:hypothetical protein [Actinomyces trachealis]